MEFFTAVILSCFVDANSTPMACKTYTYPQYQNSMEACLNVLALGIEASQKNSSVVVDYRCIAWRKTGEDLPYNENDT
mgnify:CR=1 FL=1|jgi:hypothetical protein|tara:strand:+ start:110 stop:343 length:234 start_codon:yes stop_codon:yes gene_type:complete